MVFRSLSETKTFPHRQEAATNLPASNIKMPSSAIKSHSHHQPLHNFSLPDLKWSMNHTNSHNRLHKLAADFNGTSADFDGTSADPRAGNLENNNKSKIFIRIKTKTPKCSPGDGVDAAGDQSSAPVVAEDDAAKTWNLRPRRPVSKSANGNGGLVKIGVAVVPQETKSHEPSRPRNGNGNGNDGKVGEKKVKFAIPLTKEEIEEDVYALTGSKPARRPKKRAKHLQKQLDCLFPGLWLASITPDAYRVSETHQKG